jgi:hypothetical protein
MIMSQRTVLVVTNGETTQVIKVEADTPEEAIEKATRKASPPKPGESQEFLVW